MFLKLHSLARWCLVSMLATSGFAASTNGPDVAAAAKNQDKAAVRALVKQHADVNAPQGDGSTALHWAAHWDDADTVAVLLGAGANANAANDLGVTPLYLASTNGNAAVVQKLLAAGANPNAAAATGVTPLMQAAQSGSVEAVQALLARGANTEAKENSAGQTALMWAASERHPEVIRALVAHGASVKARSNVTEVFVSISGGGKEEDGYGPSKMIKMGGSTPLLFAAREGCIECAQALLAGGASVNELAADGNSVLALAAHSGRGAFAAFLLSKDADPNAHGAGYTALHAAAITGDLDLVKTLLAHGANPNSKLENGTPLRRDGPEFAFPEPLVGSTAFLLAAKYGDAAMVRALAAAGADVKISAKDGSTPLTAAANGDHRQNGVINTAAEDESRARDAVKAVLDLGCDVNAANQAGNTALYLAAAKGYNSIVELLVENGAKLDVKNKRGATPLAATLSRRKGDKEVQSRLKTTADLLRKLGATE